MSPTLIGSNCLNHFVHLVKAGCVTQACISARSVWSFLVVLAMIIYSADCPSFNNVCFYVNYMVNSDVMFVMSSTSR